MVQINFNNSSGESAILNLKSEELDRFYDVGFEFDIELSEAQVLEILKDNPKIAFDSFLFGNDTEVGDQFFEALVKKITGESWDSIQENFKDKDYATVKAYAKTKGYKLE